MTKLAYCVSAVLGCCFSYGTLTGTQSPDITGIQKAFAGVWKEDVSKRKLDITGALPTRFRMAADGSLEELRGPESQPNVQPVVFDGKPRELPSGNTISWRQLGPATYERVLSLKGEVLATRRLTVAEDGKTLTEELETRSAGGSSKAKSVYERTSGDGLSLVGSWKMRTLNADAQQMKLEPVGSNALRISAIGGSTVTVEINGPPASTSGPSVAKGATDQLNLVNATTLEVISATNGAETHRTTLELLPDVRSMRVTMTSSRGPTGTPTTPLVLVLVKE